MDKEFKLMDDNAASFYKKLMAVRSQIKSLGEEEEDLKQKLIYALGGYQSFVNENGEPVISYKDQETRRFDVTTFKKEYPELYEGFCKSTFTEVFRIK